MLNEFKEFLKYKNLLIQLVVRDLKVRYKNSVLGFFWSLMNPLIQVATITIMVKFIMRVQGANYSAYLLAGFLPWIFFMMTMLDSSAVILYHRALIKKVYFPREVLPLASVISNLVHFILALVVFFCYLMFFVIFTKDGYLPGTAILLLPILVILQFSLLCGLTLIVSTLNLFFEDTKYILTALLNVLFYLTPIMYPSEMVHNALVRRDNEFLYKIYMLNPLNTLIDCYRKILLPKFEGNVNGVPITGFGIDWTMLGICAVICISTAFIGYAFFNKYKWLFAERA